LTNIRPEEVLIEQNQDQVTIMTRPVRNTGGIDLKLSLPEGTSLKLTSETGNIEISGAAGNVIAKTQNGNIQMNLPENMNADVALTSVNGTVRTTRAIKPVGDLDSHSLHGQIGDGGNVLVAHSKNGQVTLTTNRGEMIARLSDRAPVVRNRPSPLRPSPLRPPSLSLQPVQPLLPDQPDDDLSDQQSMAPPPKSLAPVVPQPLGPSTKQPATSSKPQLRKPDQARSTSPANSPSIAKNSPSIAKNEKKDDKKEEKDDNVLRIESQLVLLNAIVSNSSGQPVLDLKKEDFQVYEDKIQQEVSHFQTAKSPFNLVLLIDLSGSIRDKIRLIQRAALHFVQSIRPEDRVGIVTFSGITRVVSPLTNDREELRRRIETIDRPEGGTNFYDALKETLDLIEDSVNG